MEIQTFYARDGIAIYLWKMTRKEIIFLLSNIPLSFIFVYFFAFLFPTYSNGGGIFFVYCILSLIIDAIILKLIKALTGATVLVSFFEVIVINILVWYWFSNTTY